ncbi:hypothetical protein [Vibrio hepatarius]|uniref:hypothetical protein n=1 Tax=Vibrio hepatarius TaxID=171383 RepID=UPI001C0A0EB6|nr:hypothetical protein [Vibrio hepatarius]MBU2897806.1 hypothetical protein [Vibrio hepatarius]
MIQSGLHDTEVTDDIHSTLEAMHEAENQASFILKIGRCGNDFTSWRRIVEGLKVQFQIRQTQTDYQPLSVALNQ